MNLFKIAKYIEEKYKNVFLPHDDRDIDQKAYEKAGELEQEPLDNLTLDDYEE